LGVPARRTHRRPRVFSRRATVAAFSDRAGHRSGALMPIRELPFGPLAVPEEPALREARPFSPAYSSDVAELLTTPAKRPAEPA
jgi:hypothetical protein